MYLFNFNQQFQWKLKLFLLSYSNLNTVILIYKVFYIGSFSISIESINLELVYCVFLRTNNLISDAKIVLLNVNVVHNC